MTSPPRLPSENSMADAVSDNPGHSALSDSAMIRAIYDKAADLVELAKMVRDHRILLPGQQAMNMGGTESSVLQAKSDVTIDTGRPAVPIDALTPRIFDRAKTFAKTLVKAWRAGE